ncbi:hypothetical protein, partial [Neisseria maigaei]|uniref:hypothetical protein n=1 Tax=Neisseria maigaei TaxID=2830651 RepID=UPI00265B2CCD
FILTGGGGIFAKLIIVFICIVLFFVDRFCRKCKKRRKYSGLTNAGMTKSNLSASFPRKRESRTPNAAGIYRKKPKPNRLDSRLRGNDEGLKK